MAKISCLRRLISFSSMRHRMFSRWMVLSAWL
jgi:hypothetical protein